MSAKYCYWSVATGSYGGLMEKCVRSARAAGVFKEFHVLTDRPLEGCECYDAYECDKTGGLFKLHYLKVGMSRLLFDYFIWLDADTVFVRNPPDILNPLGRSPIHVPLEVNLNALKQDADWQGISCFKLRQLYADAGILNEAYLCGSAFWVVRRDAIDSVYELAFEFVYRARETRVTTNVDGALGYAMQMLCADPEAHLLSCHPEVWATAEREDFAASAANGQACEWSHPLTEQPILLRPAILHVPSERIFHTSEASHINTGLQPGVQPPYRHLAVSTGFSTRAGSR
jgi:hypothetical protein